MGQKDLGTLLPSYTTERISACCASARRMENSNHSQTEEIFYDESSEVLAQVPQKSSGCPIPGNLQDQVGQGSELPGQVKDVPAFCHRFGTIWPSKVPSNQNNSMCLWFEWLQTAGWQQIPPPSLAPLIWDQLVHWKMRQILCFLLLEERNC